LPDGARTFLPAMPKTRLGDHFPALTYNNLLSVYNKYLKFKRGISEAKRRRVIYADVCALFL
jgi:hypothetical protein